MPRGSGPYKVLALGEVYTKNEKREAIRFARSIAQDTKAKHGGDQISVHMGNGDLVYQCHWSNTLDRIVEEEL